MLNQKPSYAASDDDARAFISNLPSGAKIAIAYHGDADGTGSAVLAARFVQKTGRILAGVLAPQKGEDLFGDSFREKLAASGPDALFVLDQGSRSQSVLPGVPTLIVDHHDAPIDPVPCAVYLSGLGQDPTPTAALMTWRLLSPLADLSDAEWCMAVGVMGDLGSDAPFDEFKAAKKTWGQKNISETVALINAAKRSGSHNTDASFRALMEAEKPADIAKGVVADYAALRACRAEVQAERGRVGKTAPRFAGDWAVLRFASPCQLHGPVASAWANRLPKFIVLAANENYTPGNVHFSVRTKRKDEDLLVRLRAFRAVLNAPDLGQGHKEATGGVLPLADFEQLMAEIGLPPK